MTRSPRMLLDALTPEQVALALSAADEVASRHQRVSRAAELAVERARYEADRAERAFSAVEPENRLVARTLEARWKDRLAALAEAGQALEAARDTLPPLPSRAELEKLAADLPALWHAPATSARDRKRLLRTLIADVTLLPEHDPGMVRIGIRWHTGATDELVVGRPVHRGTARRSSIPGGRDGPPARPRHARNAELAGRLNAAGLTTGNGRPFDAKAVQWIRHAYHIPAPAPYADGEISRRRGRQPAGLQRRRHLRLDPGRAARRAARPGKPAMHHLGRPHRGRLPPTHRRIRPPQPGGPPHQAPDGPAAQPPPQCHHRMPCSCQQIPRLCPGQRKPAPVQNIPTGDCRRGSMKSSVAIAGGQDRPAGRRRGAERRVRGGFPGVLLRVPARAQPA